VSFEEFRSRVTPGKVVPVWRDCLLDTDTPVSAFAKVRRGKFAFLLESAPAGGETWARYTFLGTEPRSAWRLSRGVVEDWTPADGWHNARKPSDPLADLEQLLLHPDAAAYPQIGEFWTGAVGFFGYDVVRLIEKLPETGKPGPAVPDALFIFTRSLIILDNLRGSARLVISVVIPDGADDRSLRDLYESAQKDLDDLSARLAVPSRLPSLQSRLSAPPAAGDSTYEKDDFVRDVERIREYIRAGDCFQALLARRIDVEHDFDSTALYRTIRAINPSPYMFHLILDGLELVGSSPELLVRLSDSKVVVRPIAGTRPRGQTPQRDAELCEELLADEKERAEHIMLVDLGRNDVGRIAEYGSVAVTELMNVEKYSHVLHIVSQVEGRVREDVSALDVFKATFPAGTMTGAPKVRAMQIIDELEPARRGPYAGAVGYIAAGAKRMDLAITIRTCVLHEGVASVQAGAGIVADSVAEREWEETENKAKAMLSAIAAVRSEGRDAP
jgi:anthranilate synthase component 1